jgi:Ala-tRNA(Pro) deacylase
MAMCLRLRRLLTGEYVNYRLVPHRAGFTARELAEAVRVPPRQFAKVVVLRDEAGEYLMVVVPANARVRLDAVAAATGRAGLRLASERDLQTLFPDCDLGAMPPLGGLYGLPVLVDEGLRDGRDPFFFRGGAHDEVVGMFWADYESLAQPVFGRWSSRPAPPAVRPRCLPRAPARAVA